MSAVDVYKNLHKSSPGAPVYSIRDVKTRRVIGHSARVVLFDAEFRVSEAGRQRVLREKRKNVHAVVRGQLRPPDGSYHWPGRPAEVTYNPYRYETFVLAASEAPVQHAGIVVLDAMVRAWQVS